MIAMFNDFFCNTLALLKNVAFRRKVRKLHGPVQRDFARRVFPDGDFRVLSGPFAGMRYLNETIWGPIPPKWIGCYEAELHPVIDEILQTDYESIADVGSAEGYYAAGLARAFPEVMVKSYDTDPIGRRQLKRLAGLNHLRNLTVNRWCGADELSAIIKGRSLLICDIEGYEVELLDPASTPPLEMADILVETHPFGTMTMEQVTQTLVSRFSATHLIERILSRTDPLSLEGVERLRGLDSDLLTKAQGEGRWTPQVWLWMKTKNRGPQPPLKENDRIAS